MTNSCNTWLSYDALEGKWAVVINRAGTAQYAFTDSNIISGVKLTTTDLTGYYNSVEVRFHNIELRDREDYVVLEIPQDQRLPNEPDNRLIINAPMVNNQIQAELIGMIELKQSRLDKVIEFQTDFSYVNIEAGTIISVTNTVYGWTNKLFRVLQMSENEQDGTIVISITAQEYDANVYDDSDLFEYLREKEDGLIELDPLVDVSPVTDNTELLDSGGTNIPLALGLSLILSKLTELFGSNDGSNSLVDQLITNGIDSSQGSTLTVTGNTFVSSLNASTAGYTTANGYVIATVLANATKVPFTTTTTYKSIEIVVQTPALQFDYEFLDQAGTQRTAVGIAAQPPMGIELITGTPASPGTVLDSATIDWQSNTNTFYLTNLPPGNYFVSAAAFPTYALNMYWPRSLSSNQWGQIYPINYSNPGNNSFRVFIQGIE
jgi:hypothetical protein